MPRPVALAACLLSLLPLPVLAAAAQAQAAAASKQGNVVLYRCVGSQGAIALRDSPCPTDQRQQVITMQRPQDPPPPAHPIPAAKPEKTAVPEREVRVVIAQPPRPMYECVAPDGERYTSDTAEGRQRWVPAWVHAYPLRPRQGPRPAASTGLSVSGGTHSGNASASFSIGGQTGHDRPVHVPGVAIPVGGAWVNDECHALPQQEVCARLSDRKYEILRRYGGVMPSERHAMDLEQRGIDARMANDCPGW